MTEWWRRRVKISIVIRATPSKVGTLVLKMINLCVASSCQEGRWGWELRYSYCWRKKNRTVRFSNIFVRRELLESRTQSGPLNVFLRRRTWPIRNSPNTSHQLSSKEKPLANFIPFQLRTSSNAPVNATKYLITRIPIDESSAQPEIRSRNENIAIQLTVAIFRLCCPNRRSQVLAIMRFSVRQLATDTNQKTAPGIFRSHFTLFRLGLDGIPCSSVWIKVICFGRWIR